MGTPKIWNDSEILSTGDNDVHDGDLKVVGTSAPYTLQIREDNAWVDFFPRLGGDGMIPLRLLPPDLITLVAMKTVQNVLSTDATNDIKKLSGRVLGMRIPVVSGMWCHFIARYVYSAQDFAGVRWTVTGPQASLVTYRSQYPLDATTETINHCDDYTQPVSANASSRSADNNLVIIEGFVVPSANGFLQVEFAPAVAGKLITVKTGGFIWSEQYFAVS